VACRTWFRSAAYGLAFFSALAVAESHCPAPVVERDLRLEPWADIPYIVKEDFERGSLDVPYANGFDWGQSVRMTVVRDDQTITWEKRGNIGGPYPEKDWEGFSGSHALRFGFPSGGDGWAEQRFSLGGAYPDLWVGYWMRVPNNWTHGEWNSQSNGNNNKFFAIWMDEYEKIGPTGVIQTRGENGDTRMSPYIRNSANRHPGETAGPIFIDSSRDRGRWMQVIIHMKMASSQDAHDGKFELYRRWEDESNFEQVFAFDKWDNYHVGGNRGFAHGYLLGWYNAVQPEATDWLMDDFIATEHNLLESETREAPVAPSEPRVPAIIQP
jgi:hypothetical protein